MFVIKRGRGSLHLQRTHTSLPTSEEHHPLITVQYVQDCVLHLWVTILLDLTVSIFVLLHNKWLKTGQISNSYTMRTPGLPTEIQMYIFFTIFSPLIKIIHHSELTETSTRSPWAWQRSARAVIYSGKIRTDLRQLPVGLWSIERVIIAA